MKRMIRLVFIGPIVLGLLSFGACSKDIAKATNSTPVPWQLSADSVSGTFAISGSFDDYNSSPGSSGYHHFGTYVDTIIITKAPGDTVPSIYINSTNSTPYNLEYHDSMTSVYSAVFSPLSNFSDNVSFHNNGEIVSESYNKPQGPPGSYAYGSFTGHRIKK